ncbi:hypothetical protein ACFQ3Z_43795 [Streptomyces nogalater]
MLGLIAGFVRGLRGAGLTAGTRIVLDTGVTPEAFAVRVAAHVVGCQVVPLRPGLTREHLRDILARDIGAVVTDDAAAGNRPPQRATSRCWKPAARYGSRHPSRPAPTTSPPGATATASASSTSPAAAPAGPRARW